MALLSFTCPKTFKRAPTGLNGTKLFLIFRPLARGRAQAQGKCGERRYGRTWAASPSSCFVGDPGVYWLDMWKRKPASDAQAKAAFGIEAFNRYRAQAVELDDDRRIEAALAAPQPEPQSEDLKAKVRRLVREQEKRVQAAADRQRTSWLDQEPPDSVLIPSPLS